MKKSELNNYGISNPDGFETSRLDARRQKYDNDNPKHVKENALSGQKESDRVPETFDDPLVVAEEKAEESLNTELSTETSSASSSMASASASAGGGLGALAGVVAASVVAAVVVVAVFVSTLMITLSPTLVDMNRLIFEVNITGAQEEDFQKPIYAILTGEDGTRLEQEIDPERLTITFDGLEKGTEYLVVVKNEDKVFFERTYCTATEPVEKGYIVSSMEGTTVFVEVREAALKAGEYYTLVAKDAQGNVVFTKDGVEADKKYEFTVSEPQNLYFSLSVDGKTYAVDQIELPVYDFDNGVWVWGNDNRTATVTFADKRGGDPLVLQATVTKKKVVKATCEGFGSDLYTAKATYQGKSFTEEKTVEVDPEGHTYVYSYETGMFECSVCGDAYPAEEEE